MSLLTNAKEYYSYLQGINKQNNEQSAQQADKMMAFQREMSDTAHQREVADLRAAGLNPILSAGGQGASTPQGAMGQTDMSAASALTQYLSSLISQQTAISVAQINAGATMYAADKAYQSQMENPSSWAGLTRSVLQALGILPGSVNGVSSAGQESIIRQLSKRLGISNWLSGGLTDLSHQIGIKLGSITPGTMSALSSWLQNYIQYWIDSHSNNGPSAHSQTSRK